MENEFIVRLSQLELGHSAIIKRLDDLNSTAWKMVAAIALPIFGLFAWFFVQVWPVHSQPDTGAQDRAALIQHQYTAQDAAQDRARQEAVNTAMLQALQRLEQRRARH